MKKILLNIYYIENLYFVIKIWYDAKTMKAKNQ